MVIPDLQTDFTLPVANMPKFSFAGSTSQQKPTPAIPSKASPMKSISDNAGNLNFTFSSPITEYVPSNKPVSPQKQSVSNCLLVIFVGR